MANQAMAVHGVMEGGGSYNLHARIPAGGGILALPFLEQAVRNITFDGGDQSVVIADYGSSQGKNSLAPMRAAIKALRSRVGPDRPIMVVHIDQAANDFNTLFDVLHNDPERYSLDGRNIFPSAIGRSATTRVCFRKNTFISEWSSYAAVWLSRIPMLIPDHFMVLATTGDVREAYERQAADDWKFFLSLRASELRPGGRLVVVLPALNDNGSAGFEPLFSQANETLREMAAEGTIRAEERAAMVVGAYPRRRSELLAPFSHGRSVPRPNGGALRTVRATGRRLGRVRGRCKQGSAGYPPRAVLPVGFVPLFGVCDRRRRETQCFPRPPGGEAEATPSGSAATASLIRSNDRACQAGRHSHSWSRARNEL